MSLLKLPAELIYLVLSHLDKKDLLNVSLVFKGIQAHVAPLLYNTISWDGPVVQMWSPYPDGSRKGKVHLLLRSLLGRPVLGSYIQHLLYIGPKNTSPWDGPTSFYSEEQIQVAKSFIQTVDLTEYPLPRSVSNLPLEEFWEDKLRAGLASATLAVVLLLSQNLRSLVLDFDPYIRDEPSFAFVGVALHSSPETCRFRSLETAEFSLLGTLGYYHEMVLDPADFSNLFYLPAIKSIKLSYLGRKPFAWCRTKVPEARCLTSLTCAESLFDEANLITWLKVAPNLESLDYELEVDLNQRHTWLQGDALSNALSYAKALLDLRIITSFFDWTSDPKLVDYRLTRSIKSLKDFRQMRRLNLPMILLLGPHASQTPNLGDQLPPSLTHLTLMDEIYRFSSYEWTPSQRNRVLVDFIANYNLYVPRLTEFAIQLYDVKEDEHNQMAFEEYNFSTTEQECQRVGLNFKYVFIQISGI